METQTADPKRAPQIITGWTSDPAGSAAAAAAYAEGKSEEECFQAGFEAIADDVETVAEETEQDVSKVEHLLKLEYFTAICNTIRADSLDFEDARKAAATLAVPTVTFSEWRKRLGG